MPKQTGIDAHLYYMQYDLSGDTGSVDSIAMSRAMLDYTGIDKSYFERLPGLGDGSIAFTGYFNPTNAHTALSPMGTGAKVGTVLFGSSVGAPSASLDASQESYNVTRSQGGALGHTTTLQSFAGYGVEWGVALTAGTVSASGTGTSHDGTAATTTGASAYLHVFSVTAGTATVVVEDSADNSSFTPVTGLAFTAAAAGTAQRVATASGATLRRYTRYNISGGTAIIAVAVHRGI